MINFFRRIRKSQIAKSQFLKYLVYAIGEIVLIIIGIFIALQLNNWNESRKRRAREIKIYKEISRDLSETASELRRDRDAHIFILQQTDSLIEHLAAKSPKNERVVWWLLFAGSDLQAYPKSSGFETLSSIGLDLITNDSLRISITGMYQISIPRIVQQGKHNNQLYSFEKRFQPYIDKYIIANRNSKRLESIADVGRELVYTIYDPKIENYDLLLKDEQFFSELNKSQFIRERRIERHNQTFLKISRLKESIDRELNRLSNESD